MKRRDFFKKGIAGAVVVAVGSKITPEKELPMSNLHDPEIAKNVAKIAKKRANPMFSIDTGVKYGIRARSENEPLFSTPQVLGPYGELRADTPENQIEYWKNEVKRRKQMFDSRKGNSGVEMTVLFEHWEEAKHELKKIELFSKLGYL